MKIKEISKNDRPRERMLLLGAESLSSAELIAIILRIGNKNENVVEMSQRIISTFSLPKLSELSIKELCSIKGIGVAKALQIKVIFEISKRVNMEKKNITKISNAKDVFEYFKEIFEKTSKLLIKNYKLKIKTNQEIIHLLEKQKSNHDFSLTKISFLIDVINRLYKN